MRSVFISNIIGRVKDPAAADALKEIELASAEFNLLDIASAFTISGAYTRRTTLNVGTATLAETREFIATLIDDLKRGGENRST
jgi:hypothetical protein